MFAQEVEVLKHAASLPKDARSRAVPDQAPPPDLMASLQQAHATLSANPAERMRAEVFRPSHVLPTMTLAEQVCLHSPGELPLLLPCSNILHVVVSSPVQLS